MTRPLRIAMLTHSTNPRGGVVHSMHLSEALAELGHDVVLHAPDAAGTGFFRRPTCGVACIPVEAPAAGMTAMVEQRIADYVRYFEQAENRRFDLYHAHDGISGNALETLRERGLIGSFARTVHHIDQFSDPRLMALQDRSIAGAEVFFTVSEGWKDLLRQTLGIAAANVGNGVDSRRFAVRDENRVSRLREAIGLGGGPVFLSVGGVEARKNTIGILAAFQQVLAVRPDAQLVISGGASLLDHRGYQGEFQHALAAMGPQANAVQVIGTVADEDMPSLYRLADTLAFPSIKEGFGLVVLEAMACGIPVVVSSMAPFNEYLVPDDAIWCDPANPTSIAEAMVVSLMPPVRKSLVRRGLQLASRHGWARVAVAHIPAYQSLKETAYA